jgi:hypothetical protein
MRQLSVRKLLGVANRFRCGADGAGRYNPMGRLLDERGANTRHKSKFGACRVRQLVGEDCYAGALAAESSSARRLVLGLVQAGAGVRIMKYIIAIVTVVVGMTGLCRADDAATQQQAMLYEEDQATPNGTRFAGSAEWRTEWPAPGTAQQPEVVLRAKIEIPEQKVQVRMSLRRIDNKQLPASHTFEIVFTLPRLSPWRHLQYSGPLDEAR